MDNFVDFHQLFLSLSTPEVSDALESFGVVSGLVGIRPAVAGQKIFGPAFTVAKELNSDPEYRRAADFIDQVPEGHVVIIDNLGLETCTCWGGILTLYAKQMRLEGTVVNGMHRDAEIIRSTDYPVFSKGIFMVTGKGRTKLKDVNVPIIIHDVTILPSDIIFGDDHGVVVIPAQILGDVAKRVEAARAVEHEILNLVLQHGVPLKEARERLRYSDLTRPVVPS